MQAEKRKNDEQQKITNNDFHERSCDMITNMVKSLQRVGSMQVFEAIGKMQEGERSRTKKLKMRWTGVFFTYNQLAARKSSREGHQLSQPSKNKINK